MIVSDDINKHRLQRLEQFTLDNGILLRYIEKGTMCNSKFFGMIHSDENGTAIGIRAELTTDHKVLVLAHELGHYLTGINDSLFSTLEYGGVYNRQDKENEMRADAKGFELLYDPSFSEAEKKYLLEIPSLCRSIGLPRDIIQMWDSYRLLKKPNATSIRVKLSPFLMGFLREKSLRGEGGFQCMLRRIVQSENKNGVSFTLKDSLSMRKAVHNNRGGFVIIYKRILDELKGYADQYGGVDNFFSLNET